MGLVINSSDSFIYFLKTHSIIQQKNYLEEHPEQKEPFIRAALAYLQKPEQQQDHSPDLQLKAWLLLPKPQSKSIPLNGTHIPKSFEEELVQNVISTREFWRLKQLKKLGLTLNQVDANALLHDACQRGDLESVKTFLTLNAQVNSPNEKGMNALHVAFREGHLEIGKFLIEKGANVTAKDKHNQTPIHYLCERGKPQEALEIYKNCYKDFPQMQSIVYAAEEGFTSIAKSLIDELKNIDRKATKKDRLKTGDTLIHSLLRYGEPNFEVLKYLREKGANFEEKNSEGKTPLAWALSSHNPDAYLENLLHLGAQMYMADGSSALHQAIENTNTSVRTIETLIKNGADVNFKDKEGNTPLHRACTKEANLRIIEVLLRSGARIDIQDAEGDTPLHVAVLLNKLEIVNLLRSYGADFQAINGIGESPEWLMRIHVLDNTESSSPVFIEYELRKLLANCFSINNVSSFEGQMIKLEGGRPRLAINKVAQLLNTLNGQTGEFLNLNEACKIVEKGLRRARESPETIAKDFEAGKTLIFETGWQQHSIQVIFINDYMLLSNRGLGRKKASIHVFRINREEGLGRHDIDVLLYSHMDYKEGSHFLYEELPTDLQSTQDDLICQVIMKKCRQSNQKMGNCWWLSQKSGVLGMLTIQALLTESKKPFPSEKAREQAYEEIADSTQQIYKYFSEFTFLQLLKEYVERAPDGVERDHTLVKLVADKFRSKRFRSMMEPRPSMKRIHDLFEKFIVFETKSTLPPLYTREQVEGWLAHYRETYHLNENFEPLHLDDDLMYVGR